MSGLDFSPASDGMATPGGKESNGCAAWPEGGISLTQPEIYAVRQHQQSLAEVRGVEVSFQEALEDWQENHALRWREERQRQYLAMQREEIQRYKWIESEKARRDLGAQAVLDWIGNYAESWRAWYEREHGENLS